MPAELPPTKVPFTVITTDGKTPLTKVMLPLPTPLAPDRTKPCVSIVIDLVGIGSEKLLGSAKLLVSVIVELTSLLAFAFMMAVRKLFASLAIKLSADAGDESQPASARAALQTPQRSFPLLKVRTAASVLFERVNTRNSPT